MDTQKGNTFLIIAIIVGVFAIGAVGFASWKYFGGGSEMEKEKSQPAYLPKQEKTVPQVEEQEEKTEPYIKVISPNGGEKLTIGNTYDITWSTKGFDDNAVLIVGLVNDELDKTCRLIDGYVNAKEGKYSWKIGTDNCFVYYGNKLKIKIGESEGMSKPYVSDESDDYFSIEANETANWKTYRNDRHSYEIKYPKEIKNINQIITIRTIEEIRNEYKQWKNKGGCPGQCGKLADDENLLEKQFEILAEGEKCSYSENFKKEVQKNFILFQGAIGEIYEVEDIYNNNFKKCGIKLISYDGYDVALNNFYYRVGFLIDGKVIKMNFSLFPHNVFKEIDQLWKDLGYNLSDGSCDAKCYEKETNYYKNIDLNDEIIKNVIKNYDQIISTFKFTE